VYRCVQEFTFAPVLPQAPLEPVAVQLILGQRSERLLTVTLAYSTQQHKVCACS
jgi:hypothetical protein